MARGQVAAGQVSDEPVSLVDIMPTLAARAGAADRVPADIDGRDVWPLISKGTRLAERTLLYDNLGKAEAIRVGPWKLRVTADSAPSPSAAERVELFDLVQDPAERYDLASAHPDVVSRLRWLLEAENGWRPASDGRSSIRSGRIR